MRSLIPLFTLLSSLLPLSAGAMTYIDIDEIGVKLSRNETPSEYSGQFNIVGEPGEPDTITIGDPYRNQTITDVLGYALGTPIASAEIAFWVRDDGHCLIIAADCAGEMATVVLEDTQVFGPVGSPGFLQTFTVLHGSVEAELIGKIEADGTLAYTVRAVDAHGRNSDFYLDYGALRVRTKAASPVPEPSGAMLFGSGLAVAAVASKRRPRA